MEESQIIYPIRIGFAAAMSSGKTTLANIISKKFNLPVADIPKHRDLVLEWYPDKKFGDLKPEEAWRMCLERICQMRTYASHHFHFVVDGSSINDIANAEVMLNARPTDPLYAAFRTMLLEHARETYTHIFYLPPEIPFEPDGWRREQFRGRVGSRILEILEEEGFKFTTITGGIDERVSKITQQLLRPNTDEADKSQTYLNIDQVLGPSDQRYFATRWRLVEDELGSVTYYPEQKRLTGSFEVKYPKDWSVKTGREQLEPHLSIIDAMRILGQYTQAFCFLSDGIERPESNNMWLLGFEITPYHKILDFDRIPVEITLISDRYWDHRVSRRIWHEFDLGFNIGNGAWMGHGKVAYELPTRMQNR